VGDLRGTSLVAAIGRVLLATIAVLGGLIALDVFVYLVAVGSTFDIKVAAAFSDGYDQGYAQTYEVGYQEAHSEAYEKGYKKGYEVSLESGSNEEVSSWVGLRNPTYKELREFLADDKTDSKPFISGEYVCFDFAAELNNNAEAKGIRAAYVRLRSKEWAHAVVAFETVDRGLIFIEPQSDTEVELTIGRIYPWWQVGAVSPLRYAEAIEEIQIIW
jgi:hypothetical protein